jgi:hypothetical protein
MKTLLYRNPDQSVSTIARFWLVGDQVDAAFDDPEWEPTLERGIRSESGRVKRSAGRAFYDALDKAFANSSRMWVESDDAA